MEVVLDNDFLKRLKKLNVRIKKSFRQRIIVFSKNPSDPQLNNHQLSDKYKGYKSIDITSDWRALYKEIQIGEETVAYFLLLGTHEELYSKEKSDTK